jgi:DNA polymerase-3 subunit epsilon
VLDATLARYLDLPRYAAAFRNLLVDVDLAGRFPREECQVVFAFGKHPGRPPAEVARQDPRYLAWLRRRRCCPTPQNCRA